MGPIRVSDGRAEISVIRHRVAIDVRRQNRGDQAELQPRETFIAKLRHRRVSRDVDGISRIVIMQFKAINLNRRRQLQPTDERTAQRGRLDMSQNRMRPALRPIKPRQIILGGAASGIKNRPRQVSLRQPQAAPKQTQKQEQRLQMNIPS